MSKFGNVVAWFKDAFAHLKAVHKRGAAWIGTDGLINMETSALLTIFLMIFLPVLWAMFFSAVVVVGKSAFDKSTGHINEGHDLICAIAGVLFGLLLGIA